jgi:hypothetical protein
MCQLSTGFANPRGMKPASTQTAANLRTRHARAAGGLYSKNPSRPTGTILSLPIQSRFFSRPPAILAQSSNAITLPRRQTIAVPVE